MDMCVDQTAIAAEAAVEKKVEWIRNDQERRVLALEERQAKMLRHAQLAEAWADEVEKVRRSVASSLAVIVVCVHNFSRYVYYSWRPFYFLRCRCIHIV